MTSAFYDQVREMRAGGMEWDSISEQLKQQGIAEEQATEAITAVKQEIRAKNRNTGMILLGIGSALCFFSMLYTFMVGHNYFMLYGLTLIGITVAFIGLVYVMG